MNLTQYFYSENKLATAKGGQASTRVLIADNHVVGETHHYRGGDTAFVYLQEQQNSVMQIAGGPITAYDPYGYFFNASPHPFLTYTGQHFSVPCRGYLLGNGHRLYLPLLRRFTSPDFLSPFSRGGLNSYAYCSGDPVNFTDPSGKVRLFKWFGRALGLKKTKVKNSTENVVTGNSPSSGSNTLQGIFSHTAIINKVTKHLDIKDFEDLQKAMPDLGSRLELVSVARLRRTVVKPAKDFSYTGMKRGDVEALVDYNEGSVSREKMLRHVKNKVGAIRAGVNYGEKEDALANSRRMREYFHDFASEEFYEDIRRLWK